jgi:hypothetical protein
MDYNRNSKNRKLKTEILSFFSRLNFSAYRLGLAGKSIICCSGALLISLFFPWISFHAPMGGAVTYHFAFSLYLGGIGFAIIAALVLVGFFLLSHEKKERFRGYVPFRLSDAQAIVFIATILSTATLSYVMAAFAYKRLSSHDVMPELGIEIALSAEVLLFVGAYFFSQSEKSRAMTMSYFDKVEHDALDEYRDILQPHTPGEGKKEKNMTLPI